MSFQAYLDNIEDKTGKTPGEFIAEAKEKGFADPRTNAGTIVEWLKRDYSLGRGHAMALVHVIKKGPQIGDKHVGTGGTHSDESNTLRLDGSVERATGPTAHVAGSAGQSERATDLRGKESSSLRPARRSLTTKRWSTG